MTIGAEALGGSLANHLDDQNWQITILGGFHSHGGYPQIIQKWTKLVLKHIDTHFMKAPFGLKEIRSNSHI